MSRTGRGVKEVIWTTNHFGGGFVYLCVVKKGEKLLNKYFSNY